MPGFATGSKVGFGMKVICQLQADYSARAYRRDPRYPDSPAILAAVVRFVLDAVRR